MSTEAEVELASGRQPTVRGLWLGQWIQDGPPGRVKAALCCSPGAVLNWIALARVGREFPLQKVAGAMCFMDEHGRASKVVLTC